tara:strand:- start:262 stop:666 length:405 start_codon:yes stop_codon:yes gene_type:complete
MTSSYNNFPTLKLTPYFEEGSVWPSYKIEPYNRQDDTTNDIPEENKISDENIKDYYNSVSANILNTITSQPYKTLVNPKNNSTIFYPIMPNIIDKQTISILKDDNACDKTILEERDKQLWYYKHYIPENFNDSC